MEVRKEINRIPTATIVVLDGYGPSVNFDISEKKESYTGKVKVTFTALHNDKDLRLDFNNGTITNLKVNGKAVTVNHNGAYLTVPKESLVVAKNILEMDFAHPFSKSGRGFHRAVDPKDGRIYVYTNLEPFDANQVFPSFDQPDLKATYEMVVKAPKNWKVITSVLESNIKQDKTSRTWTFPRSARFSTYIWSLHAGDFKMWADYKFRYPLRLFARKSLAKYVKPEQWFRYTRASFDYLDTYFAYPYPYKKYDQVIVPEFFSGAMENVAAVTFNENFVSKGKKSRNSKRSLAGVIAHEMAHMWFGNLVTMKWWNDLWLNESFATYMAAKAIYSSTEFKEAWRRFSGRKSWAIWEDELPTTHPIEGIVPDVLKARTNFDGISYGKGASVLRQVNFLIGEKAFQEGMKGYFKKYANTNTVLKDFMASLQSATDVNLSDWQKEWLQTSGVNTVEAQWTCESDKIKSLNLKQTYKEGYPHLRTHKLKVALVYKTGQKLNVKSFDTTMSGTNTNLTSMVGQACPIAVDPNYASYAYIKTEIDPMSLKNANLVLSANNESFLRQEYWMALWRMVRKGTYSVVDFAKLMNTYLGRETDDQIVEFLSQQAGSVAYYLPKDTETEKKAHQKFVKTAEQQIWKKLTTARAGSEQQKSLFGSFTGFARTKYSQNRLYALLTGKTKLKKFKVNQDRRWSLIQMLSATGFKNYKSLITQELKKDSSLKGKKSAIVANVSYPSLDVKKKFYNKLITSTNETNFDEFARITWSLFPSQQFELHKKFEKDYYGHLLNIENKMNPHFAAVFARLAPVECDVALKDKAQQFLTSNAKLRPATQKSLKVKISENERCQVIRNKAKQSM